MTMIKNELTAAIAEDAAQSNADVSAVLASLACMVLTTLKSGSDVTFGGVGKLSVATREARQARNPSTNAPAKTVVNIKFAKALADTVD